MQAQTAASPQAQGLQQQRTVIVRASQGNVANRWPSGQHAPLGYRGPPVQMRQGPSLGSGGAYGGMSPTGVGGSPVYEDQDLDTLRSPGSHMSSMTTLPGVPNSLLMQIDMSAGAYGASPRAGFTISHADLQRLVAEVREGCEETKGETADLRCELERSGQEQAKLLHRTQEQAAALGALQQALAAERDGRDAARAELEKSFSRDIKDMREHMNQELERLRDTVMREMRERMDGQKVLREEVQLQQGSLLRLTSRVEETLVEMRTEMPRLSQDGASLRQELESLRAVLSASPDGHGPRIARLESALSEERAARHSDVEVVRSEAEQAWREALQARQRLAEEQRGLESGLEDLGLRVGEQQRTQELLSEKATAAAVEAIARAQEVSARICTPLQANLEQLAAQLAEGKGVLAMITEEMSLGLTRAVEAQHQGRAESREVQGLAEARLTHLEHGISELDTDLRRWAEDVVAERELSMQSWVGASVGTRLDAVDRTLRKEMSDRAAHNGQIMDRITHNAERWCQLQAKFDDLMLQMHRTSSGHSPGLSRGQGISNSSSTVAFGVQQGATSNR